MQPLSIIICSWNNEEHTKLLLHSIKRNSAVEHEICLHINEPSETFLSWALSQNIQLTYTRENIGLTGGTNQIVAKATKEYLYLLDDDMYVMPDWDVNIIKAKDSYPDTSWINSTMIEPGINPSWCNWVIGGRNYGTTVANFNEQALLKDRLSLENILPVLNSTSTPILVKKYWWDFVGGYNTDVGPAIGSEEHLAKRFWDAGFRTFVSVPNSLVYHFQRVSTSRLENYPKHAASRDTKFIELYGITCSDFNNNYIKRGQPWLNMSS